MSEDSQFDALNKRIVELEVILAQLERDKLKYQCEIAEVRQESSGTIRALRDQNRKLRAKLHAWIDEDEE